MGAVSRRPYAIGWVRGRVIRSLTIGLRSDVEAMLRAIARGNGRVQRMFFLTESEYLTLASWPIWIWGIIIFVAMWATW